MSFMREYLNIQSRVMLSFSRMSWQTDSQTVSAETGRQTGRRRDRCTCRLPRGQYSVRMQVFGGSMHAPTNLVRCSF